MRGNSVVLIILHGNKLTELVTSLKSMVFFKLYPETQKAVALKCFLFFDQIRFESLVKAMHTLLRKRHTHAERHSFVYIFTGTPVFLKPQV